MVPVAVRRNHIAVPVPVGSAVNDSGVYVVPSVLTSSMRSEPSPAVVLLNIPKDNWSEVRPTVSTPWIWNVVPTVVVRKTLPLPDAPVYPVEGVVIRTSPEPENEIPDEAGVDQPV